ncbi:MAG: dienelactone hydrolase family protein [Caulobacterales bacterium]
MLRAALALISGLWALASAAAGEPVAVIVYPPQPPPLFATCATPGSFSATPPRVRRGAARSLAPGVTAQDVTFASDTGSTVKGELIAGDAPGPRPGVLFVHWLGDAKTTNHTEFESDATALAKHGAVSLLVDAMWSDPKWFDSVGKSERADLEVTVHQLLNLRIALDVLAAQPGVDPARIAYVGHDFGAMMGPFVACADARPSWYVLMAGVPTLSEWYLLGKPAPEDYVQDLDKAANPALNLSRARLKGVIFQFATRDHYIAADRALAFIAAAPTPKGVFWYDADHSLAVPAAFDDRQAWLVEKLFEER